MPTTDSTLIEAARAAVLPHLPSCGGVVLANGYLAVIDDGALLVYDNNGRFVRGMLRDPAPVGTALADALTEIAELRMVTPQVKVEQR